MTARMSISANVLLLAALFGWALEASGGGRLFNGGFETVGPDGRVADWTYDADFYSPDVSGGRNGTRAFRFDSRGRDDGSALQQRVKATPGLRYHFGVWVRTENLTGKGFCARICLQWEDRYGRFIDGSYHTPHVSGTHGEWVKCDGVSVRTPANAVWVTVRPEVVGPASGRAWFDDVFLEPYDTDPVRALFTSAYRNEQAEGAVTFAASLNLPADKFDASRYRGLIDYRGADGRERRVAATFADATRATAEVQVRELAPGESEVAFVLTSADGKALGRKTCPFVRTAAERKRHVTFDRLGRCLVDGKPFFPLGMYWSVSKPYHKFRLPPIDASNIVEYVDSPFNCTMPYQSPTRAQMDVCQANGIKVIYALTCDFDGNDWDPSGGDPSRSHAPKAVRHIAEFKDHPALLAWYLNDERDIRELENLAGRYRTVKALDPDHPAWIALYQYDQIREYMATFDAFGTDPYPISGSPIGQAYQWASVGHAGAFGMRPMWQVPQAMDWSIFRNDRPGDRMPTREEMTNMSWQHIAGGANGLIYYSYTYLRQCRDVPFEKAWADVRAAAQTVKDRFEMLLADGTPPKFAVSCAEVAVRTWRRGRRTWVLAVNTTQKPQRATVRLENGRVLDFALDPIAHEIIDFQE